MFYESRSDFFYDPKSNLYYGNKKGAYFRYDATKNPPFVEVQNMVSATAEKEEATKANTTSKAGSGALPVSKEGKKVIAIKLKTKKMKKPIAVTVVPKSAPVVNQIQKQQVAYIEKWTEQEKAKRAEAAATKAIITTSKAASTEPVEAAEPTNVVTTAKGEPMCVVCRRKFPTVEKLNLHENMSELHKQNLAKLAAAKEKKRLHAVPSVEYHDRAKKRRELHGPEIAPMKIRSDSPAEGVTIKPTPEEALGTGNIGNQMLQKLGWKSGSSLGRKSEEGLSRAGSRKGEEESLRKDWEKIEALVSGGSRPTDR
jgi:RNA-binding protein 5/10